MLYPDYQVANTTIELDWEDEHSVVLYNHILVRQIER